MCVRKFNIDENGIDKRDEFEAKNNFEHFNLALCVTCVYFSFVKSEGKKYYGKCRLLESLGAYQSVSTTDVCDKFISYDGFNINGKRASKRELPSFAKLTKRNKYIFAELKE